MRLFSVIILLFLSISFVRDQQTPIGAWEHIDSNMVQTLIIADDYFTIANYNLEEKKFGDTYGGTARFTKAGMSGKIEFSSSKKEMIGKSYQYSVSRQGNEMVITRNGKRDLWKRVDDGKAALSGNWRLASREQNGKMVPMTTGSRKTIKVMSATRFQWAAINTETGEFFGTGGGRYSLKDGKYTEMIEFFSRDSSRVGMSLVFNALIDGSEWMHSGKSSKGDPLKEIWLR